MIVWSVSCSLRRSVRRLPCFRTTPSSSLLHARRWRRRRAPFPLPPASWSSLFSRPGSPSPLPLSPFPLPPRHGPGRVRARARARGRPRPRRPCPCPRPCPWLPSALLPFVGLFSLSRSGRRGNYDEPRPRGAVRVAQSLQGR